MRFILRFRPRSFSPSAALFAALLFAAPLPARAEVVPDEPPRCGNGYCDAWVGEDASTCPADCVAKPAVPGDVRVVRPYPSSYQGSFWRPADAAPDGFRVVKGRNVGLIVLGAGLLAIGYGFDIGLGVDNLDRGGAYAAIPVVGPFIAAGAAGNAPCPSGCGAKVPYAMGLGLAGAAQLAGVVMLIVGLVVPQEKLVRDTRAFIVTPVPLAGRSGTGLGVAGTF